MDCAVATSRYRVSLADAEPVGGELVRRVSARRQAICDTTVPFMTRALTYSSMRCFATCRSGRARLS